jgi:hypothetical protein
MADTSLVYFDELTEILGNDITEDQNYFYISRPNEILATNKDTIITLDGLFSNLRAGNAYYNSGWLYKTTGEASLHEKTLGANIFSGAPSGTVDTPISWSEISRTGLSSNDALVLSIGKNTFEDWASSLSILQVGGNASVYAPITEGAAQSFTISQNVYDDGAEKYVSTDGASKLVFTSGDIISYNTISGTADSSISWLESFRTTSDGKISTGGETTPLCSVGGVHIFSVSAGTISSISGNADNLVIEDSSNGGLTILSSTTGNGNIYFGDSNDSDIGRITYNHGSDRMEFYVSANEAFRVNSGRDVTFNEVVRASKGLHRTYTNRFTTAFNQNSVYDSLIPYLPPAGNAVLASGSVLVGANHNPIYSVQVISSSAISIQYGMTSSMTMNDGNTSNIPYEMRIVF